MSALIFIVVLGVLVIVHEYGHFIVARLCGIRVEKFSIGFGPVILSAKPKETEYCVSLLPLGGYVKLSGESPEESKGASWEFSAKSIYQRAAVVLAGPFMNAFLAFVLFFVIFVAGQPMLKATVGKVLEKTPAAEAGIQVGDRVIAVNGKIVRYWDEMLKVVHENAEVLTFTLERNGKPLQLTVTPTRRESRDLFGKKTYYSFVGVAPGQDVDYVKSPVGKAVVMAADRVWTMTLMIFASLGMMLTGAMPFKDSMTGPIGIFFMTQQAAQMGFLYLLYFMGSLSVSLFVLNLLPIPVLDGGHLLFILIEHFKGSPLKDSVKERMTQGGLILLLGLMVFVVLQDVSRFSLLDNVRNFLKAR